MADALPEPHTLPARITPDPDAQALVNDFIDHTEFYPSDLIRSLTLIGKLDELYLDTTAKVHDLSATYGDLPSLPAAQRQDAQFLRKQISAALDYAIHCRESASAEANRLYLVTERHCARISTVKRKLQQLPLPPSLGSSPTPVSAQTQSARTRKAAAATAAAAVAGDGERKSRITLHLDSTGLAHRQASATSRQKGRDGAGASASREGVRSSVSGSDAVSQGLGSEPDIEVSGDESSGDHEHAHYDRHSDKAATGNRFKSTKIRIPKIPKVQNGAGYDSASADALAALSTSNMLANLEPPPADAKPGSKHAPWYKLTEWEMARLRKRMKKNAIWNPSDTMIRRELTDMGRGRENYEKARAHAEATGEEFLDEDPIDATKKVLGPGEISFSPLSKEDMQLVNRGMRLNEAKKLKKETLAREQAARDAMEIDEASRKIADAGHSMKSLFTRSSGINVPSSLPNSPEKAKNTFGHVKKRKREGSVGDNGTGREVVSVPAIDSSKQAPKRLKIAPPRPLTLPGSYARSRGLAASSSSATAIKVPLAPAGSSVANAASATIRRATVHSSTPLDSLKKISTSATAAMTRPRRASGLSKATTPDLSTPGLRGPNGRPRSRGGIISTGAKAASAEPPSKGERRELRGLRRGSNASLPTSPRSGNPRVNVRRGKKAAPGLITAGEDGGTKVSVGKRKAAPRKRGSTTDKKRNDKDGDPAERVDSGEAGEDVDPNEERYCYCGDVSYGTMIACEADDVSVNLCFALKLQSAELRFLQSSATNLYQCELEWFHIACVGLSEAPPRRSKWWCPDCRKRLGMDDKGNAMEGTGRRR